MELNTGLIAFLFFSLLILLLSAEVETIPENSSHGIWRGELITVTAKGGLLSTSSGNLWVSSNNLCESALRGDSVLVLGYRSGMYVSPFSLRLKLSDSLFSLVRRRFRDRLCDTIYDPTARGLTGGLLMGLRGMIPQSASDAFQNSGTSHLLALSGLHTGIIAGLLLFVARVILGKGTSSAWAAVSGITAFVILSGGRASTVRAGIMASFAVLWIGHRGGRIHLLSVWWIALLISLIFLPETLRDRGAQMSYGAVLSLIVLGKNIRGKLSFMLNPLYAGVVVTVSLAPLISEVYGGFCWAGPAATVVSIPFMLAVMLLGFLCSLGLAPCSAVLGAVSSSWVSVLNLFSYPALELPAFFMPVWILLLLCIRVFSRWNGFQRRFR